MREMITRGGRLETHTILVEKANGALSFPKGALDEPGAEVCLQPRNPLAEFRLALTRCSFGGRKPAKTHDASKAQQIVHILHRKRHQGCSEGPECTVRRA